MRRSRVNTEQKNTEHETTKQRNNEAYIETKKESKVSRGKGGGDANKMKRRGRKKIRQEEKEERKYRTIVLNQLKREQYRSK